MKFSPAEKIIISMLSDIHKHLKIEGDIDPDFLMKAIVGGHHWAIEWEHPGLFTEQQDAETTVREVANILDMWSFMETAYARLSPADQERVKAGGPFSKSGVKFRGFDGNNEGEQYGIATFLIHEMGRFEHFKKHDLNSHGPSIEGYRRMLKVFEPLRTGSVGDAMAAGASGLSADQLVHIINARA